MREGTFKYVFRDKSTSFTLINKIDRNLKFQKLLYLLKAKPLFFWYRDVLAIIFQMCLLKWIQIFLT